jgi:ATP-dependent DNA helicase RecQ
LSSEQTRRVLNALNGEILSWENSFSGRAIEIADPELIEPAIDDQELNQHLEYEQNRLDAVVKYASTHDCRQQFLISYFGENTDRWQCACCDNCDHNAQLKTQCRNLSESELDAAVSILECVRRFNGRFGRGKLSLILCGARRSELQHLNVQQSSHFGVLRSWKQDQILDFLRALEKAGLLTTSGGDYPCLMTTSEGEDFIDCPENIMLDLKKSTETPVRQRKSRKNQADDFRC